MPSPAPRPKFDVEVCADVERALPAWRALAGCGQASFYQTEEFILPWLATCGRAESVTPFFVIARDAEGAPMAFLPLGLRRYGPLRLAQFLGGKHANYNLGLFHPNAKFSAEDLRQIFYAAAQKAGRQAPHLYLLANLPLRFNGAANPLAQLPNHPGADSAYAATLIEDGEAFLAQNLSADTRKKLRKKASRLAAMAPLHYFRATNQTQANLVLDAFFAQKRQRYAAFADAENLAILWGFFGALTRFGAQGEKPAVELHALALGKTIIATFAAAEHGRRLHGLFNSFDADSAIAASSPGDLLLTEVCRDACARHLATFDLGLGDARYKKSFCPEVESMVDVLLPTGLPGYAALPALIAALAAKRALKANKGLWRLIKTLRRPTKSPAKDEGLYERRRTY